MRSPATTNLSVSANWNYTLLLSRRAALLLSMQLLNYYHGATYKSLKRWVIRRASTSNDAEWRVLTFSWLSDPPSYHVFTSVINHRLSVHLDSEIIIRDDRYYGCHGHNYVSLIITSEHLYLDKSYWRNHATFFRSKKKLCISCDDFFCVNPIWLE